MLGWDQLCGQRNLECCYLLNGLRGIGVLENITLHIVTGERRSFAVALAHDAYSFRVLARLTDRKSVV